MHHIRTSKLAALVTIVAAFSGCISNQAAKEISQTVSAPLYVIARTFAGAQDLGYATEAFRRRNGRWPKDFAELSTFVQKSDGFLVLGHYDRVDFFELPEDALRVAFVPEGQTNQVKLTFSPKEIEPK